MADGKSPFPKYYSDALWATLSDGEQKSLALAEKIARKNNLAILDEEREEYRMGLINAAKKISGVQPTESDYEVAIKIAKILPEDLETIRGPFKKQRDKFYQEDVQPDKDVARMDDDAKKKAMQERYQSFVDIITIRERWANQEIPVAKGTLNRLKDFEREMTLNLSRNFGIPADDRGKPGVNLDVNENGRLDKFELIARGAFGARDMDFDTNSDGKIDKEDFKKIQKFGLAPEALKELKSIVEVMEGDPALFTGTKKEIKIEDKAKYQKAIFYGVDDSLFRASIVEAVMRDPDLLPDLRKLVDNLAASEKNDKLPEQKKPKAKEEGFNR